MPAPIRAVVFDLDGTLLDHAGAVTTALRGWLPTLGQEASDELVAAWFAAEERHLPAWRARQISFAEQRRRRLRDILPLIGHDPGDDATLDEIFAGYLRHYEASWRRYGDVDDALADVVTTGLRIAILANGTEAQQHAKLVATGLPGRVGPVFTAEAMGVAKPDPASYLTVCAALDLAPAHVLHIGDRYDLDVVAARAAGLQAVHLDRVDAGPHDEQLRITALRELAPLLR